MRYSYLNSFYLTLNLSLTVKNFRIIFCISSIFYLIQVITAILKYILMLIYVIQNNYIFQTIVTTQFLSFETNNVFLINFNFFSSLFLHVLKFQQTNTKNYTYNLFYFIL